MILGDKFIIKSRESKGKKPVFSLRSVKKHQVFFFVLFLYIFAFLSPFSSLTFAGPVSPSYELKQYDIGTGSSDVSTSPSYNLNGISGGVAGGVLSSPSYKANTGLNFTMQANVPPAPAFTNPSNYYNKLKLVLDTGNNATDAKYAIAISTDSFVSDTKYVQNDNTVGVALGLEDWQTYTNWGSASGITIIGLIPDTTYTVKVAAKKGNFTETGYGPSVSASTVGSKLTFDIDVAATDTETSAPFLVSIGSLSAGSVVTATNKVWVDIDTNGAGGGTVYVYGTNGGLLSSTVSSTIPSSTADLSSGLVTQGYGAISSNLGQASGGPIEAITPYNNTGDNVGLLDSTKRIIFGSSGEPVTSGRAAFQIKAKASNVTKAAADYSDTVTVVVSAAY